MAIPATIVQVNIMKEMNKKVSIHPTIKSRGFSASEPINASMKIEE